MVVRATDVTECLFAVVDTASRGLPAPCLQAKVVHSHPGPVPQQPQGAQRSADPPILAPGALAACASHTLHPEVWCQSLVPRSTQCVILHYIYSQSYSGKAPFQLPQTRPLAPPLQGFRTGMAGQAPQRKIAFRSSMIEPELPFSFRSSMTDPPLCS